MASTTLYHRNLRMSHPLARMTQLCAVITHQSASDFIRQALISEIQRLAESDKLYDDLLARVARDPDFPIATPKRHVPYTRMVVDVS